MSKIVPNSITTVKPEAHIPHSTAGNAGLPKRGGGAKPLPTKKSNPCPVCGDSGGKCRTFAHEPIVLCGNEHSGEVSGYRFVKPSKNSLWSVFAPAADKNDDDWRQRLEARDRANRLKVVAIAKRKPVADRDKEYRSEFATLRQPRRDNLKARGLTDSEIDWAISQHWLWDKGAGFAIAALSLDGLIQGCQVARDDRSPKYIWDSKDGSGQLPGSGEMPIAIWMHPECDTTKPIKILACDSFLKGLVAGIKHWRTQDYQTVFVGAPGCNFQPIELRNLLETLKPVSVSYAPDAGDVGNEGMMNAIATFAERCAAAGHEPSVLWWGQVSKPSHDLDDLSRDEYESAKLLTFAEFLGLAPKPESEKGFTEANPKVSPNPAEYARFVAQQEETEAADEAQHNQKLLDRIISRFAPKKEKRARRARVEPIDAPAMEEIIYEAGLLPPSGAEAFIWIIEPTQQREFVYEAIAKGYGNLLNASGTGVGKSHSAGLLNPERIEFPAPEGLEIRTDGTEGQKASPIWYFSHRSRNPSTKTIEANFTPLRTRHQGLEPTGEVTPMGHEVYKPVINADTPTAGNCKYAHLFVAMGEKNYDSCGSASANPICGMCEFGKPAAGTEGGSQCATSEGEGYGFRFQRRKDMASDRLRLNPQSAPAEMPQNVLGVFEEVGDLLSPKVIKAGISDLNAESIAISEEDPELATRLAPIIKAIRGDLGGGGAARWGVTSTDIAQVPEVAAALEALTEYDRALILDKLEPIIKLNLSELLNVGSFSSAEEGKVVRSLRGRLGTASKRAAHARELVEVDKREQDARTTWLTARMSFLPGIEWLEQSSVDDDNRKAIEEYWQRSDALAAAEIRTLELEAIASGLSAEYLTATRIYEEAKDSARSDRKALTSEAFARMQMTHTQFLWDCLNILFFPGEGYGDFRIAKGKLILTLPDSRIKELARSTAGNLYLDATVNAEILKNRLGLDSLLQFRTPKAEANNVRHFQVEGFGKCGNQRAATTNERLHALHGGIRERAIAILGTEDFQIEICDFKSQREEFGAKLGHLQNTRGSNAIAGAQVLVVHGWGKPNLGAVFDEYAALSSPDFTADQFYQQKCDDELRQLCGRQRANLEPEKDFLIFWVTEDELPVAAEKLAAEDIREEAAHTDIRMWRRVEKFLKDCWTATGKMPTQKAIAAALGTTQGWISKIVSRFAGGMAQLKAIVAGLISPPDTGRVEPSEDEKFIAEGMMPAMAEMTEPETVAAEINTIIQVFGWQGWARILRATKRKIRTAILINLLGEAIGESA